MSKQKDHPHSLGNLDIVSGLPKSSKELMASLLYLRADLPLYSPVATICIDLAIDDLRQKIEEQEKRRLS